MPTPKKPDSFYVAVLDALARYGTQEAAAMRMGVPRATYQSQVMEARRRGLSSTVQRCQEYPARIHREIENGRVLVFSDAHYTPGEADRFHTALLEMTRSLRPSVVVCLGDVLDAATIGKHPRIGWEPRVSLRDEIDTLTKRLGEIQKAARGANLVWTLGNHDSRFDSYFSSHAEASEGLGGVTLAELFPEWRLCWRFDINPGGLGHTILKHRMRSGIHAGHNNAMNAGVSLVAGHLHRAGVYRVTDARGTRYGVDPGCLSEINSDAFVGYTEDGITGWRSGFAVLTYREGVLLPPELVEDTAVGIVFRGEIL